MALAAYCLMLRFDPPKRHQSIDHQPSSSLPGRGRRCAHTRFAADATRTARAAAARRAVRCDGAPAGTLREARVFACMRATFEYSHTHSRGIFDYPMNFSVYSIVNVFFTIIFILPALSRAVPTTSRRSPFRPPSTRPPRPRPRHRPLPPRTKRTATTMRCAP